MIDQLLAVEQYGVDRRSWVVAHLESGLSAAEIAGIEGELLALDGVDGMTNSTDRELDLIASIETPVADLENYRTLGLDGDVDPLTVSQRAKRVSGVDTAFPRIAHFPDSHVNFFHRLAPIATAITLAIALVLVVRLVVVRAYSASAGSLPLQWLRLVVVVGLPVVLTILGATVITALVWPPLIYPVVSRSASHLISGRAVAAPGLDLAIYAGFVVILLSLVALANVERRDPRHRA
jgi:hypothetical protein